ncbi:MAG: hypothetical protein SFU56_16630 [Capsulimonadales bacterium]|nr:hypothetical protein [Capsulimonadales bacterium]
MVHFFYRTRPAVELPTAVISLNGGGRAIVSGGHDGIEFSKGTVRRVIAHTHPFSVHATGPSIRDLKALKHFGQKHSYVIERGVLTRFGQ